MRTLLALSMVVTGLLPAQSSKAPAVSGRWVVTADFYGTPLYLSLELTQQRDKLTGTFDGDKLEGSIQGDALSFVAKDEQGNTAECKATVQGVSISGSVVFTDAGDAAHPTTRTFTAQPVPQRRTGAPQRHEFTPTVFYRQFSSANKPS